MAEHPIPADLVDLGDVTLLPGLVDAHVHLGFDGGPGPVARMKAETDTQQLILMLRSARELLSAGVTAARDLGARSPPRHRGRRRDRQRDGRGPRLLTAARPLTPTGGHCWFMGGECDTADDLRRIVRLHHKMGADFVKVMSTGGFVTEGAPPWSAQFRTRGRTGRGGGSGPPAGPAGRRARAWQAGHHPGRGGTGGHHRALLIRRAGPQVRLGFRSGRGGSDRRRGHIRMSDHERARAYAA